MAVAAAVAVVGAVVVAVVVVAVVVAVVVVEAAAKGALAPCQAPPGHKNKPRSQHSLWLKAVLCCLLHIGHVLFIPPPAISAAACRCRLCRAASYW